MRAPVDTLRKLAREHIDSAEADRAIRYGDVHIGMHGNAPPACGFEPCRSDTGFGERERNADPAAIGGAGGSGIKAQRKA